MYYLQIDALPRDVHPVPEDQLGRFMGCGIADAESAALQLEWWAKQIREDAKDFTPGPHWG
jgi:hypothetical protein